MLFNEPIIFEITLIEFCKKEFNKMKTFSHVNEDFIIFKWFIRRTKLVFIFTIQFCVYKFGLKSIILVVRVR
jgi:hypothetical protein